CCPFIRSCHTLPTVNSAAGKGATPSSIIPEGQGGSGLDAAATASTPLLGAIGKPLGRGERAPCLSMMACFSGGILFDAEVIAKTLPVSINVPMTHTIKMLGRRTRFIET